ncbi:MAG: hypothetical protein HY782_20755 [Chloroflexi bacterium]|nr:hypothetical protein [Chloroflexota bacterium]
MRKKFALLSALAIGAAALVTYQPGFKVGFFNGWWYLEWAGTMDLPRYLIQFFDPRNVTQGYRPVQGLYVFVQYLLFRFNFDGFYLTHMLLHAANSILLFLIVARLGKRGRLALIAGLVYAVSPVYSLAVFWHAVVDPLSTFFYLLTILLWTVYQETLRARHWTMTFVAYLFALFSKEVAAFLPFVLFLVERWFYHRKPDWRILARQYAPLLVLYLPYTLLELNVQTRGEFVGQFGFTIGPHMLTNLMPYLAVLAFPWTAEMPGEAAYYIWLAIAALVYLGVMLYKRSTTLLFLAMVALLNIVLLLGFPLDYFNTRYLYTSTMVSAVLIAAVSELALRTLGQRRVAALLASAIVAVIVVASSARVADAAAGLAEFTRQIRVPFRDISRQHPTFPDDTLLYFVYSPNTRVWDYQGLSFVRYGTGVKVDGTDSGNRANLRGHNAAFVYYFDPTGRPIELPVEKEIKTRVSVALPVSYAAPITLDSVQVVSATIQRGKALVVLLDWSASATVDKDYALFVHLVDRNGENIAGYDGPPKRGESPTTTWRRGQLIVEAVVLPVASDAPLGDNYRLEVGMYDPATMQRLSFSNGAGDVVVIQPFAVVAEP